MKQATANRYLRKEETKGTEIGRIFVHRWLQSMVNLEDEEDAYIEDYIFNGAVNRLDALFERRYYDFYKDTLYPFLLDARTISQGFQQYFFVQMLRLKEKLNNCSKTDILEKTLDYKPVIMTRTQYDRYRVFALSKATKENISFQELIFTIVDSVLSFTDKAPKELIRAIEPYRREKATNKRILALYNAFKGRGYYTLPNGIRSDAFKSLKEWQMALSEAQKGNSLTDKEIIEEARLKMYDLYYKGFKEVKAQYKKATGETLKDITEAEIMEAIESLLEESFLDMYLHAVKHNLSYQKDTKAKAVIRTILNAELDKLAVWHTYEEEPELTKYDLLLEGLDLYNGKTAETQEEKEVHFAEFKQDFPELFKTIESYIQSKLPSLPPFDASNYFKPLIDKLELEQVKMFSYEVFFHISDKQIVEEMKTDATQPYTQFNLDWANGIAILERPTEYDIDQYGNYKANLSPNLPDFTIEQVAEEKDILELISSSIDTAKSCVRQLLILNEAFRITEETYKVYGITKFLIDEEHLERHLESYNYLVKLFYAMVLGSKEEKAKKRALIRKIFPVIDFKSLTPDKEITKELRETFKKFPFSQEFKLKNTTRFINQYRK